MRYGERARRTIALWKQILEIMVEFTQEHQVPPTTRDIQARTRLKAISHAHSVLVDMADRGLIKHHHGMARSYVITQMGIKFMKSGDEDVDL